MLYGGQLKKEATPEASQALLMWFLEVNSTYSIPEFAILLPRPQDPHHSQYIYTVGILAVAHS